MYLVSVLILFFVSSLRSTGRDPVSLVQVFQWAGERPPDISCPLDCYSDRGVLTRYPVVPFDGGLDTTDDRRAFGPQTVVPTISVQVVHRIAPKTWWLYSP